MGYKTAAERAASQQRWRAANRERANALSTAWNRANPAAAAAIARRKDLKAYGLVEADYDRMLAAQGGLCAGCLRPAAEFKRRLSIDHDHTCCPGRSQSCGRCLRGLLCSSCNQALGLVFDDAALLARLIDYLATPRERLAPHTATELSG